MTVHVILGAGPAGVIAAETIRKYSATDSITIVGDEKEAPYSRMAIPYLLMGNVGEGGTHLRKSAEHFKSLNINVVQARATAVQGATKTIVLDNGQSLKFDKLLVATGSTPTKAPISGMDLPGIYSCWTLADARDIIAHTKPGSRVLQMGAGFIGCIIMEALAARGVKLSVVEMGDRMVPRMMGPAAGNMIKDWCQKKGVQVYTGAKVESITAGGAAPEGLLGKLASAVGLGAPPSDAPLVAKLSTGQRIEADVIISATGVKPTIGFLKDSGVNCKTGVLTDDRMQTNVPGIYAAGDCAEAFDHFTGQPQVSAIQPNAADQARVAALNMVGQTTTLKQVTQINVLDTLGLISTSFGSWQGVPGGDSAELVDNTNFKLLSMQFKGDVMVGCNSIGWTEHVGALRGLVEGKVHLGEWKETLKADPTKLAQAYIASAQAQSGWNGAADARRR
jgi:NADPH-dependent 2,4-dienoyl-CoA reductase/sulfur reductase-like enzyme